MTTNTKQKGATEATKKYNKELTQSLPFENTKDFEDAQRGFIGTWDEVNIESNDGGHSVWNLNDYKFIEGEAPDTVNPSLWRNAKLNMNNGLYQVTDRVYQLRGYDMANITIIEGDTGLILIDSLMGTETATAAMKLYFEHRPRKPIVALIYSHSHADHYGGSAAIVSHEDADSEKILVLAPEGFMEHAVSENVFAGTAMFRRAEYMYGSRLAKGAMGQVDAGLGKTASTGQMSLVAPNKETTHDHEKLVIDGIEIEFIMAPNTEAPAEHMMYFPQFKMINISEDAIHNFHNILTLRGAQIRDAYSWWKDLDKVIRSFGDKYEVCIGQHHWPTWGNAEINEFLENQRDAYKFLHDQTLHFINEGLTPIEVAEAVKFPPNLENKWYLRGYYGSLNHNVKAIYQFYLGWFDGNPATLHPIPPVDAAKKYVEYMGDVSGIIKKAQADYDKGEYRWVAEIMRQVVFADDTNTVAKELLADSLEQMGYQAESGPWRNFYLAGADELRNGVAKDIIPSVTPDIVRGMTFSLILDYMGIRLNGERAEGKRISMNWILPDVKENYHVLINNSVLIYRAGETDEKADLTLTVNRTTFNEIFGGSKSFQDAFADGTCKLEGNAEVFGEFASLLDEFNPVFNIVTP